MISNEFGDRVFCSNFDISLVPHYTRLAISLLRWTGLLQLSICNVIYSISLKSSRMAAFSFLLPKESLPFLQDIIPIKRLRLQTTHCLALLHIGFVCHTITKAISKEHPSIFKTLLLLQAQTLVSFVWQRSSSLDETENVL